MARLLGERLGLPYVELDSLYHGPGWTVRESWVDEVKQIVSGAEWVIEWQGDQVRGHMNANADLLVWLDHARWLSTYRVLKRTLRRRVNRSVLWAGNTEGPLREFFTDPDHIVRFSWRMHPAIREKVLTTVEDDQHLHVIRLRGQRQVDAWLDGPLRTATSER